MNMKGLTVSSSKHALKMQNNEKISPNIKKVKFYVCIKSSTDLDCVKKNSGD